MVTSQTLLETSSQQTLFLTGKQNHETCLDYGSPKTQLRNSRVSEGNLGLG